MKSWLMALFIILATPVSAQIGSLSCSDLANVGYQSQTLSNGTVTSVWYPTRIRFGSGLNAPVSDCARFPLVVFSHGFGGCATQSTFFTEVLARAGYIVVAPTHADARCDGTASRVEIPFFQPGEWSEATYNDRRNDVWLAIDEIIASPTFGPRVDSTRIAGAGHSLGGYTMMGVAGAWPSWHDPRLKAVLLFSPYAMPYQEDNAVQNIHIPVMYQGGTRDAPITPIIESDVYPDSNAPKYFVKFSGAGHLAWTNITCRGFVTTAQCISRSSLARAIVDYGLEFLEHHLRGVDSSLLHGGGVTRSVVDYYVVDRGLVP